MTIEIQIIAEDKLIDAYMTRCATCKHFEGMFFRDGRMWLDDTGTCTRYPPVLVSSRTEDSDPEWEQPECEGGDHCGEHKLACDLPDVGVIP